MHNMATCGGIITYSSFFSEKMTNRGTQTRHLYQIRYIIEYPLTEILFLSCFRSLSSMQRVIVFVMQVLLTP